MHSIGRDTHEAYEHSSVQVHDTPKQGSSPVVTKKKKSISLADLLSWDDSSPFGSTHFDLEAIPIQRHTSLTVATC